MGLLLRILSIQITPRLQFDPKRDDGPLTIRDRWIGAIPMFLLFMLIAGVFHVSVAFHQMFQEMDLSTLPAITEFVFSMHQLCGRAPWLVTTPMFVIAWIYFSWICKRRIWAQRFGAIMGVLFFIALFGAVVALFLPLVNMPLSRG